ncbi:MAG: ABC transporter permease, partial [Clostridia bacterium]|nr:ABC transporter permease [Clostridia bacterium]
MMFVFNLGGGLPNIEYTLMYGQYVLLLMVPILCMRSMAEDRRNKTDMFYLSLPMKTSAVVVGKYLSLLTVLAIPCLVICLYPLLLGFFGTVNYASAYVGILFFFLTGAALIAVCQFLSALTDNLVVAAVLAMLASVLLFFLPYLADIIPDTPLASFIGIVIMAVLAAVIAFLVTRNLSVTAITGAAFVVPTSVLYIIMGEKFEGLLSDLLVHLSPFMPFQEVAALGIFSVASLVTLLSYPLFFVFLTVQAADKKRWS